MTALVLYRDPHWLALDKPVGVITTPNGRGARSLVEVAREIIPTAECWHPVNRLDKVVSGLVLFALDSVALAAHESSRANNLQHRGYTALVSPPPAVASGQWGWPVGLDPSHRRLRKSDGVGAERAVTNYRVLATVSSTALVELLPETGRTHQLRVHCARAGCPIVGDRDYRGAVRSVTATGAVYSASRVMLHASWRVVPALSRTITADLPQEMQSHWLSLGGELPHGLAVRGDLG